MKKMLLLLGVVSVLVSCKQSIKGTLDVQKSMKVSVSNDCGMESSFGCESSKELTLNPGVYQSEIMQLFPNEYQLVVPVKGVNEKVTLAKPDNFEFPLNGTFTMKSAEIKQDFDVDGFVSTTQEVGDSVEGYESCQYIAQRYVCRHQRYHRPRRRVTECGYENYYVWGTAYSRWFYVTTEQQIALQMTRADENLAQFASNNSSVEKQYEFQGVCR